MTYTLAKSTAEPTITGTAAVLVKAATDAADESGVRIVVAVTDGAGHPVAFERADGACFLAMDVAIDKPWMAAASGMTTHLWNIVLSAEPKSRPFPTIRASWAWAEGARSSKRVG